MTASYAPLIEVLDRTVRERQVSDSELCRILGITVEELDADCTRPDPLPDDCANGCGGCDKCDDWREGKESELQHDDQYDHAHKPEVYRVVQAVAV